MSDFMHWIYPLRWGETVADQDWTPLHFHRLLGSDFVAECCAAGVEGRAWLGTALLLWAEAMKQDPGGTLPDNDVSLARLAGYGADIDAWRAVRPNVMRGWVPTIVEGGGMDEARKQDRLGHPSVLTDAALHAWTRKDGRKKGRAAAHLSQVKWKVRKQMEAQKRPRRIIDSDDLVTRVAQWLIRSGLQVSGENVASGLAVAGVPVLIESAGER